MLSSSDPVCQFRLVLKLLQRKEPEFIHLVHRDPEVPASVPSPALTSRPDKMGVA